MTSPRVFIVQQPTKRDSVTGEVVPAINLSPAKAWGEPVFLLGDTVNPFTHEDIAGLVASRLEELQPTHQDWFVLVGNPVLIGIVAALAADRLGTLRLLQWHRHNQSYLPFETTIFSLDD